MMNGPMHREIVGAQRSHRLKASKQRRGKLAHQATYSVVEVDVRPKQLPVGVSLEHRFTTDSEAVGLAIDVEIRPGQKTAPTMVRKVGGG